MISIYRISIENAINEYLIVGIDGKLESLDLIVAGLDAYVYEMLYRESRGDDSLTI